jgi:DNA-binding NarL/FixJ family response regulator
VTLPAGGATASDSAISTSEVRVFDGGPQRLSTLTDQERNVLDLIGQGLTNREIAGQMFLSEKTVKNYVTRLFLKCQLRNRTEAAIFVLASRTGERETDGQVSG